MLLNIVRRLTYSKNFYSKEKLIKIDLVPPKIHKHLFESSNENNIASCSGENFKNFEFETIKDALNYIELPQLRVRGNLMDHFDALGKEQFDRFLYLRTNFEYFFYYTKKKL